jgi:hypothetical protein
MEMRMRGRSRQGLLLQFRKDRARTDTNEVAFIRGFARTQSQDPALLRETKFLPVRSVQHDIFDDKVLIISPTTVVAVIAVPSSIFHSILLLHGIW